MVKLVGHHGYKCNYFILNFGRSTKNKVSSYPIVITENGYFVLVIWVFNLRH